MAEEVRSHFGDQVLKTAGASKSQLYHYFADKDELVRAVIARSALSPLARC